MPLIFKAPVEFFHSDLYPDRCLLTGRTENLHHFDIQLPYLNAGVAAIVLPLRPNDPPAHPDPAVAAAAAPHGTPFPPATEAAPAAAPTQVPTGHPPLPQQRRPWWAQLLGSALWIFLATWLGSIFDNPVTSRIANATLAHATSFQRVFQRHTIAISAGSAMALWILFYNLLLRARHRRRIDRRALHFTIALSQPTPAERRTAAVLTLLQSLVSALYYLVLFALFAPLYVPVPVGMTAFWIVWMCFFIVNRWRTRRFSVLRLFPKQRELEISLPDARKHLYDDLCTCFMRWKQREHFATDIHYDIDSEVDDFPDIDSGSWDQAEKR